MTRQVWPAAFVVHGFLGTTMTVQSPGDFVDAMESFMRSPYRYRIEVAAETLNRRPPSVRSGGSVRTLDLSSRLSAGPASPT